jgi:hypothetical protein
MPIPQDSPVTDPATQMLTRYELDEDDSGQLTKTPTLITDEIAHKRADLLTEYSEVTEPVRIAHVRALVVASVLEEAAARLRIAAETDHPAGSVALADLADELAYDLQRREGLWD